MWCVVLFLRSWRLWSWAQPWYEQAISRDSVTPPDVREYIWENFGGGSFRSGSEKWSVVNTCWLQQSTIIKICPSAHGHLLNRYSKGMLPPCHTLLSSWDASKIEAQNWLTRYPTVDRLTSYPMRDSSGTWYAISSCCCQWFAATKPDLG